MKKKMVLGLLGISLLLSACSKNDSKEKHMEEYIDQTFDTESVSDLGNYKEELLDLSKYDTENDENDEIIDGIIWNYMAISDKGYYYWVMSGQYDFLYFMDKATGKSVPLCNRPDCEHIDDSCNAYFKTVIHTPEDGIEFDRNRVMFLDGYVYVIGHNMAGEQYLYRVSEDGSKQEQYMRLYKKELTQTGSDGSSVTYTTPEICIHKGYVYFIIPKESVPTIYRMQLGSEKVEKVFEIKTERPNLYRMLPYGDFLFFQAGTYSEDYLDVDGGIFAYNITNGEIKLVKSEAISAYKVVGNSLYYAKSDGVYRFAMDGTLDERIVEYEEYTTFSADEKYIYIEGDRNIIIYDINGDYILTPQLSGTLEIIDTYFGDSKYIFAKGFETVGTETKTYRVYIEVSQIENGTALWQKIN